MNKWSKSALADLQKLMESVKSQQQTFMIDELIEKIHVKLWKQKQTKKKKQKGGADGFLSEVAFASLPMDDVLKKAMSEEFKYANLSDAQSRFLPDLVSTADDVFVKASTGSGKTLGFLIPSIQDAFFAPSSLRSAASKAAAGQNGQVKVLILSPSRELATQTAHEAQRLLRFAPQIRTGIVMGGTDRGRDARTLSNPATVPHVLVATPGRLEDLMFNVGVQVTSALTAGVRVVVLDEADRLLDMGFAPAIRRILAALPPPRAAAASKKTPSKMASISSKGRRTLMFTATVDDQVLKIAKDFMRADYKFLDSAPKNADGSPVVPDQAHIKQSAVISNDPGKIHMALAKVLQEDGIAKKAPNHKILVFFPSNALVAFFADLFKESFGLPVLALSGDLPQRQRDSATERFRTQPGQIMFASDVAGRGMDFPGVTLVVQIGATRPDVYKQRVGRTGRGGADGEAVIVLGGDERRVLEKLRTNQTATIEERDAGIDPSTHPKPLSPYLEKSASRAFRGMLGAYNSELKQLGWSKQELVDAICARFRGWGLSQFPEVNEKTLKKMGLQGVVMPLK